eukprot:Sspe_Gene.75915::Locus_47435_Transcript_1_1_Confidence_1.000_Length_1482::g.75915::m.75915
MDSAMVTSQLTADDQSHLIDQRIQVDDKFADTLNALVLVSHVGDGRYGKFPMEALKRLKHNDVAFGTDIQQELEEIELRLRRQKLETQWQKEGKGQGMNPEDEVVAMQEWIEEQIQKGGGEVNLKLPKQRGSIAGVESSLKQTGQLGTAEKKPPKKTPGDRVRYGDNVGVVIRSKNGGLVDVKFDSGVQTLDSSDLVLLSKGHPAMLITLGNGYKPRKVTRPQVTSRLACLFSQAGTGETPEFVAQPGTRRQEVAQALEERKNKMMIRKPHPERRHFDPASPPRKTLNVAPRYLSKAPERPMDFPINKEAGEQLGLIFDPETMCLTEAVEGSPASSLEKMRGMRLTHVSFREDAPPFNTDEGIHSKEHLRKAMSKATGASHLVLRLEPWTMRRAVEKKRKEFTEKLVVNRDKALKGSKAKTTREEDRAELDEE